MSAEGKKEEADIEATSLDNAIVQIQKKGITTILEVKEKVVNKNNIFYTIQRKFFRQKITQKDIVLFSRQVSTLFEAGVSALKAFRLLAQENENKTLQEEIMGVADDIESLPSVGRG
jgi:type IV pilus assembly protein PilC